MCKTVCLIAYYIHVFCESPCEINNMCIPSETFGVIHCTSWLHDDNKHALYQSYVKADKIKQILKCYYNLAFLFCPQVAIPAKDWNETYDATEEGPACSTLTETPISEDCLRLNVYTTKVIQKFNFICYDPEFL